MLGVTGKLAFNGAAFDFKGVGGVKIRQFKIKLNKSK